jgi:hypothetical protein
MGLPSKVRSVDTSITFSRDIKIVHKIFGEILVPTKESGHSVL